MKLKTTTIIFLFFITLIINAQQDDGFFEGRIIYNLKIEDVTNQLTVEELKETMGDVQIYTSKGNKYKSDSNGSYEITQYYLGNDTIYNYSAKFNLIMWEDATINTDEIISYKIQKNAKTINGEKCNVLSVKSKEGSMEYYYSPKVSIRYEDYQNHNSSFFNFCIEKTNALPLGGIFISKFRIVELEATKIIYEKIDDSEFDLPENVPMRNINEN